MRFDWAKQAGAMLGLDVTLAQERRRKLVLKKQREEKAKQAAEQAKNGCDAPVAEKNV